MKTSLPKDDLFWIAHHPLLQDGWNTLRGQSVFVTGGTGFIGRWLLESFVCANRELGLDAKMTIVTRRAREFSSVIRNLGVTKNVTLLSGDLLKVEFPKKKFTHLIHAGNSVPQAGTEIYLPEYFDVFTLGTKRVFDFARKSKVQRALYISSGAVYGPQPNELMYIPEDWLGGPDPTLVHSVYAEGKRAAESLCSIYNGVYGLPISIARCFALVGPHLPLDGSFAIGNFIKNAMAKLPIQITGDGTPLRSYLYSADLTVWLWSILFYGTPMRPYNVGSEKGISILALAELINEILENKQAIEFKNTKPANQLVGVGQRYIPSTQRVRKELGLVENTTLEQGIHKTVQWIRKSQTTLS